jgi:nucleotide-binding universal stress UspA family protein
LPVVTLIRDRGILREFPDRTETDLYLWLAEHRAELESALGWEVAPDAAAEDLVSRHGATAQRVLARVGEKLLDAISIDELEPGPPPGEWRALRQSINADQRIFPEILVALNGGEGGWRALEQAIAVAQQEESEIRGLHVVPTLAAAEPGAVQQIRDRFHWRLGEVGIHGRLVVEEGDTVHTICDRARWNDLLTLPLTHPPGGKVLERLSSGFRSVVQRCPRPVLAVPREATAMKRALLGYDASAKALEALYVSTYLAARWGIELTVLTVGSNDEKTEEILDSARAYLEEHGVRAEYVAASGKAASVIVETAERQQCDFLVLGGYGASPVVEIVLGSELNEVLRHARVPILICR